MAPNKFEKHIKKQLQEREIQPSANAWETLSERLDAVSARSKKRNYFWYGMAASFVGILLLSVVYFNVKTTSDVPDFQVVESPKRNSVPKKRKAVEPLQEHIKVEQFVTINSVKEVIQEKISDTNPIENEIDKENKIAIQEILKKNIGEEKVMSTKKMYEKTQNILNTKILEVAAQVNALKKENIDLTDAEVDSLLRKAQREIVASKVLLSENSIDPMVLLTDVEDELDQSFRDKIFESLKKGFIKVRTAVADSDN